MIIWISSYPKSGNTWIRSLLASYLFSKDGVFNFRLLKNIKQFSTEFYDQRNIKELSKQGEISKNWIPAQKEINKDKKIHFLKTHNALCTINGNSFTDKFNTKGVIYVVRDPRNVITSLVNHYEISIDEALDFIINKRKIIFPISSNKNKAKMGDFNFLSDWASHYNAWKNINFCSIKIVKYEDIMFDTKKTFMSILKYLSKHMDINLDERKILNSIETTSFEKLSEMEDKDGFDESITSRRNNKKVKFFKLGKNNMWKNLVDRKIIKEIELRFKNEMNELGYL